MDAGGAGGGRRVPVYRYKASKLDGKKVSGQMQAVSKAALHEQLQTQNLFLTAYEEWKPRARARSFPRVSLRTSAGSWA